MSCRLRFDAAEKKTAESTGDETPLGAFLSAVRSLLRSFATTPMSMMRAMTSWCCSPPSRSEDRLLNLAVLFPTLCCLAPLFSNRSTTVSPRILGFLIDF